MRRIFYVMAADAELYKGVDIQSFPAGGYYGPNSLRAGMDRQVQLISLRRVLRVNAAVNPSSLRSKGRAIDRNRDGWVDVGPTGETLLVLQSGVAGIAAMLIRDE